MTVVDENAPLTEAEILSIPLVEATAWTPVWLEEADDGTLSEATPGAEGLGPVFNEQGLAKAVLIRPCMSRGAKIRGLSPIYTPKMLEANAAVFAGWPMYVDHLQRGQAQQLAKSMGGQVRESTWDPNYIHPDDKKYGYQKGAVIGTVWATPKIRETVGNNPDLLHLSISGYPTAGKPGAAPWNQASRGMVIEGIRDNPVGSVDFVPRGGAGGRLQPLKEGEDPDTVPWPTPAWEDGAVSIAGRPYDPAMTTKNSALGTLRERLSAASPELLAEFDKHLPEGATLVVPAAEPPTTGAITEADVSRLVADALKDAPTPERFQEQVEERVQELLDARETQRHLAGVAAALIEATDLPNSWKHDLKAQFAVTAQGPTAGLLVEGDDALGVTPEEELTETVNEAIEAAEQRLADARGVKRPRVTGQGGAAPGATGDSKVKEQDDAHEWRSRSVELGIFSEAELDETFNLKQKTEG